MTMGSTLTLAVFASLPELPLLLWLALAVLGYVLVTGVLYALAEDVQHQRERHDLVVEARRRRIEYRQKGQQVGKAQDKPRGFAQG